jgi:hypothetical protein
MAFIEIHPRNVFQGLLLVNVDDIKCVYRICEDKNHSSTVLRLVGENKPLDVEESYDEIKRLIAQALVPQQSPPGMGFALSPAPMSGSGHNPGRRQ